MITGRPHVARSHLAQVCAGIVFAIFVSACGQQPTSADLARDLNSYIESRYTPGLIEFTQAKRLDHRIVPDFRSDIRTVTFTAALKLKRDYDFGAWDQVNATSLAIALGSRAEAMRGVKAGGNKAGDILTLTGSVMYQNVDNAWRLSAGSPSLPQSDATTGPDRAALIAAWARMTATTWRAFLDPTVPYASDIADATKTTIARATRLNGGIALASGRPQGDYWNVAQAILHAHDAPQTNATADKNVASQDASESLGLLRDGSVGAIIIRADEAAFAAEGQGPFQGQGTFPGLRALASLFPEHIHVVVPAKSGVASVTELFGKRVAIVGGSQAALVEAGDILRAHRVGLATLADTPPQLSPAAALAALQRGERDAVIVTAAAPLGPLSHAANDLSLRVLPLDADAVALLTTGTSNYIAMTIPARTYPGQNRPVATVGVSALLVSTDAVPAAEVEELLKKTFAPRDFSRLESPLAVMIRPATAQRGITLPLHAGAAAFYAPPATAEPPK